MATSRQMDPCPNCGAPMPITAIKCGHCGQDLVEDVEPVRSGDASADAGLKWLVPIGRSGWAIAAGYLGLLACFPVVGFAFGVLAVITGILALRHMKRDPRTGGMGRAIFGIVAGGIAGLANLILNIALVISATRGR